MSDRNKLILLLVLVGVFLAVNLRGYISPAATAVVSDRPARAGAKPGSRIPDAVVNDQIDLSATSVVAEAKRNIFQYGQAANPIARGPKKVEPTEVVPEPPKPPPPAPVRFFGTSQASAGGALRAFLTNGEETFIVREGDMFMQRYRLARIGNDNVEIIEVNGPNRWVVPREQQ